MRGSGVQSERREGLPSHPPKRTSADRRGTAAGAARRTAASCHRNETNVEPKELRTKTEKTHQQKRGSMSALSSPKPGRCKSELDGPNQRM